MSCFYSTAPPPATRPTCWRPSKRGRTRLAAPTEIEARLGGTRSPVMLCGHTHIPRVVQLPAGALVVNPGSVGLPAYDDVFPEYHVVETGSPHARYALLEKEPAPGRLSWSPSPTTITLPPIMPGKTAARIGKSPCGPVSWIIDQPPG